MKKGRPEAALSHSIGLYGQSTFEANPINAATAEIDSSKRKTRPLGPLASRMRRADIGDSPSQCVRVPYGSRHHALGQRPRDVFEESRLGCPRLSTTH